MRNAAASALASRFGDRHWARTVGLRSVTRSIDESLVLIARLGSDLVASLRLATKKPWAIDVSYFTKVDRALYLLDMAVHPHHQGNGFGRQLLTSAAEYALAFPADAIRLDAYDAQAGAGGFYTRCGFRETGRVVYRRVPLIYFERLLRQV